MTILADDIFDCPSCGACCRSSKPDTILIPDDDLLRWRRQSRLDLIDKTVEGHFSERAFATIQEGETYACVHLGIPTNQNACSIYQDRGTTCRAFEPGSTACLGARRRGYL